MSKMDVNESCTCVLICGVIAILFFIGGIAVGTIEPMWDTGEVSDLGQSICEEEYNQTFDSYSEGNLYCKPLAEHYDGIKVVIGGLEWHHTPP